MNLELSCGLGIAWTLAATLAFPVLELPADDPPAIVARVDGYAISAADVERELKTAFPQRPLDGSARQLLRQETIELLIRRQLAIRYLKEAGLAATAAEVELAVERLKQPVQQREESWEDYLRAKDLDESSLRQTLTWQIGWRRLLEKYLTDDNLQCYFDKHRREFDGTELRVAHILFALDQENPASQVAPLRQRSNEVLAQVRAGELTFAEAAQRYSAGPSRDAGGEIGWIGRRQPMPESFSRAAFQLEANQISEPTETHFGIHLIRCLEIRPGQRKWGDVRQELERAVARYLFEWAAEQMRPQAQISREGSP